MKTYLFIVRKLLLVYKLILNFKALLNEGDIPEFRYKKFQESAYRYYRSTLDYMEKKFPISDKTIVSSAWLDVDNRVKATWEQVQYFLDRYSDIECIQNIDADKVYDKFCDYQSLSHNDIPEEAWDEAKVGNW